MDAYHLLGDILACCPLLVYLGSNIKCLVTRFVFLADLSSIRPYDPCPSRQGKQGNPPVRKAEMRDVVYFNACMFLVVVDKLPHCITG